MAASVLHAEGFAGGAVVGALLGPPGFAAGMVVGAVLGSQGGPPSESDFEPQLLVGQLRDAVPRSGSAIVLIAAPGDVDDMLAAIGDTDGEVTRQPLTADQVAALQATLRATPAASRGPSAQGEQAIEASKPTKS